MQFNVKRLWGLEEASASVVALATAQLHLNLKLLWPQSPPNQNCKTNHRMALTGAGEFGWFRTVCWLGSYGSRGPGDADAGLHWKWNDFWWNSFTTSWKCKCFTLAEWGRSWGSALPNPKVQSGKRSFLVNMDTHRSVQRDTVKIVEKKLLESTSQKNRWEN